MREIIDRNHSIYGEGGVETTASPLSDENFFHYVDTVMADIDALGLATRQEVIAYFHYKHGWPREFLAKELGMPEAEVRRQIGAGKQQLLKTLGITKGS